MTKVYKYGALAPTSGAEELREQERLAHAYRRRLLAIEQAHHAALDAIEAADVSALTDQITALQQEISIRREQAKRSGIRADVGTLLAELKAARASRKGARDAIRESHERAERELTWRCAVARAAVRERRGTLLPIPLTKERWLSAAKADRERLLKQLRDSTALDPPTTGEVRSEVLAQMLVAEAADWPDHWVARKLAEWKRSRDRRRARADSGLYHGTYIAVETAVQAAVKAASKLGQAPRSRYVDSIKIGTQCQGGVTARRVEILAAEPMHDAGRAFSRAELPAHMLARGSGKRTASRRVIRIRIASDDRGTPVWCALPVCMHRPLPDGATVLWAYVVRRNTAQGSRYEVQLTVSTDTRRVAAERHAAVAVDVGWRTLKNGDVRVAWWAGTDGREGQILVPSKLIAKSRHAQSIGAIRDQLFEAVLGVVVARRSELPADVREAMSRAGNWKAHRRLVRVATMLAGLPEAHAARKAWHRERNAAWRRWSGERSVAGLPRMPTRPDEVPLEWYLECWRRQELHLLQWQEQERQHAIRSRDEIYRISAARLAARYQELVPEGTDSTKSGLLNLAVLAQRHPSVGPKCADDRASAKRFLAAPGECRTALVRAFAGDVAPQPLERTTSECHMCGEICSFDAKADLAHTCEHCGQHWDQDQNAARNLLWRRERSGGAHDTVTARREFFARFPR